MNPSIQLGITFSLFIHLALYVMLKKQHTPISQINQPLLIEWASTKTSSDQQQNSKKSSHQSGKKHDSLSKLLRNGFEDMAREVYGQKDSGGESVQDIEVSSGETVIDLQKTLDNDRLLPKIWRQIRAHASYRPEHIRERIQGTVQVRVRLGRRGELLRIFEEAMTGPRELQGWVLLFLIEALKQPYLKEALPYSQVFEFSFVFFIRPWNYEQSQTNQNKMVFSINGTLPAHVRLAQNAQDLFADEKLKNKAEWSFYERLSIYEKACEHGNAIACQKGKEMERFVAR